MLHSFFWFERETNGVKDEVDDNDGNDSNLWIKLRLKLVNFDLSLRIIVIFQKNMANKLARYIHHFVISFHSISHLYMPERTLFAFRAANKIL